MTQPDPAKQTTPRDPTRVGHCKRDPTDVYVGRGPNARDLTETPIGERGWLGNPFSLDELTESDTQEDETIREASIRQFRGVFEDKLQTDQEFENAVRALAGSVLGCWCQSLEEDGPACHAEVIAEHADRLAETAHCGICGTPASETNLGVAEARNGLVCVQCTMFRREEGVYPDEAGPHQGPQSPAGDSR
jgi:hypothetical protein